MGTPVIKRITTRRTEQIVREAGFTEKKDLKDNFIGHVPLRFFKSAGQKIPLYPLSDSL